MYYADTLPSHVIAADDDGTLYTIPNVAGGWQSRKPYRGHVTALRPMDATTTRLMRRHLGCPDDEPTHYSTAKAAEILGVDTSRVRRMAANRGLGQHVGRAWVFTADDIDAMRDRPPGRRPAAES